MAKMNRNQNMWFLIGLEINKHTSIWSIENVFLLVGAFTGLEKEP